MLLAEQFLIGILMAHPYRLVYPKTASSCAVFNACHSGYGLPDAFTKQSELSIAELRSSEDAFVDQLIAAAPDYGAPILAANFSRAYVDANRAANELDPALIFDVPRQKTNARVAAGLGVLPRIVADGKVIQAGKITLTAAEARLKECYFPYHRALENLVGQQKQKFGLCLLFDFHSMPQAALKAVPQKQGHMPDIILGDRFGLSCDRWLTDSVEQIFSRAGFVVARNAPFAGGYITRHYGKPKKAVHTIQIEINRSLYMDEKRLLPLPEFEKFRNRISDCINALAGLGPTALELAAE